MLRIPAYAHRLSTSPRWTLYIYENALQPAAAPLASKMCNHNHTSCPPRRWRNGLKIVMSNFNLLAVSRAAHQLRFSTNTRGFTSVAGGAEHHAEAAHASRHYLERWAGIRGGGTTDARPDTAPRKNGTPSFPRSASSGRKSPQSPQAMIHFFGRTYLVPTIRVPPFPHSEDETPHQEIRGGGVDTVDEEERRVFEWMGGMLAQGNGALGTTGIVPDAGSPVVLDLGAISQDGSPHRRPAGRASLVGAARAVRAAGFVPVGVCNTSHDVLKLAAEEGLPEVMMVQARPRHSASPAAAQSAVMASVRESNRRHLPSAELSSDGFGRTEPSAGRTTSSESPSSITQKNATHSPDLSSLSTAAETMFGQSPVQENETDKNAVASALGAAGSVPVRASHASANQNAAPSSTSTARQRGAAEGQERGFDSLIGETAAGQGRVVAGSTAAVKETLVFEGSVRSGQQVYADGTSLVVFGAVSSGGEVMADGDIHVYGHLRGRALAGLSGNTSAKIFSTRFDAELVGIADNFTTCHEPEKLAGTVAGAPTTVCLRDGKLVVRSLDTPA